MTQASARYWGYSSDPNRHGPCFRLATWETEIKICVQGATKINTCKGVRKTRAGQRETLSCNVIVTADGGLSSSLGFRSWDGPLDCSVLRMGAAPLSVHISHLGCGLPSRREHDLGGS